MTSLSPSSPEPIFTRDFRLLFVAHFLQALGFSSMLLLPLYLDFLGANRTEVGAIMAVSAVGGLLTRPLVGWALDVVGRKPTLTVGTVVLVAGMMLVGAVDSLGPLVWILRILVGIGGGALFSGYFTFASDIIPASRRTEGLALFGISGLVPLLVNPLTDWIGITPTDLRVVLPIVGGIILCSLFFLLLVREPQSIRAPERVSWTSAWTALRDRSLLPVWVATCVFGGLVAVFFSFVTVMAADRGMDRPASVWLTYAGAALLVRLLGARLPRVLGPNKVVSGALLSYIGGLLVSSGAQSNEGFMLAGFLAGIGHGYAFPVLTSQMVTRVDDALRGIASVTFTGLWALSRLLLAPLFGWIADISNDGTMMQSAAGLAFAALVLWALMERHITSERRQPGSTPL